MKKSLQIAGFLQFLTEIIALVLCVILIIASAYYTALAFGVLMNGDPSRAIVDALFIVILLELFYAVRSFIKRGSINVGVIVNVGIIASVKEMIFKLHSLEIQMALAFAAIFLSLGILYVLEVIHYEKKRYV